MWKPDKKTKKKIKFTWKGVPFCADTRGSPFVPVSGQVLCKTITAVVW